MSVDEGIWKFFQQHLEYSDAELEQFKSRPQNEDIIKMAPLLMNKTLIAEVKESSGCNSRHRVGDRFFFDGAGNLLTRQGPSRICVHALAALSGAIYAANEVFYAGGDPNRMKFNRVACFDVGVACGGWGRVVLELSLTDRQEA